MSRVAREFLEAFVLAVVVFLVIQISIQNFKVEGSSMHPTLEEDQYLLVNKLVYFRLDLERLSRMIPFWKVDTPSERFAIHPPKRGDVIVFRFPKDPTRDFVKRVVGLPGEQVEVRQGEVYINGNRVPLPEPYVTEHDRSNMEPIYLMDKEYFVLGDNRAHSNDSRAWGPVPEPNMVGKVWFVYWPVKKWNILHSIALPFAGVSR